MWLILFLLKQQTLSVYEPWLVVSEQLTLLLAVTSLNVAQALSALVLPSTDSGIGVTAAPDFPLNSRKREQ